MMRQKTHERLLREERRRFDEELRHARQERDRLLDRVMALAGVSFDMERFDTVEPDAPGEPPPRLVPVDAIFEPEGELEEEAS